MRRNCLEGLQSLSKTLPMEDDSELEFRLRKVPKHRVYVRSPAWPGDAAGDGRTAHVSVTSEIHPNTHPQERAKSTKDGSDTPAKHTKHRSKAFSLPLPLSSKRAKARFGRIEPFHWPCLVLSSRPSRTDLGPTPGLGTKPLETVDPIFLELCCAVCRAESQGC
jgi:hypothetical protein